MARTDEIRLELFDAGELAVWLGSSRATYLDERITAGDTLEEASADADASMERTFPGGEPGPGQTAGWLVAGDRRVGTLWLGPHGSDPSRWWVWDIAIDAGERGRGLGRAAMVLAEEVAAAAGATSLGLNVFAGNAVARSLYLSLGYAETSVQMRKDVGA